MAKRFFEYSICTSVDVWIFVKMSHSFHLTYTSLYMIVLLCFFHISCFGFVMKQIQIQIQRSWWAKQVGWVGNYYTSPIRIWTISTEYIGMYALITSNDFFFIPLHVNDTFSIFQQITKVNFCKATNEKGKTFPAPEERDMSDVSLAHTFAQVTCCLLSKVFYSKHQEAIQPSADHILCNRKNYLLGKSLAFLAPTNLPGFLCRGRVDIFRFISFLIFEVI